MAAGGTRGICSAFVWPHAFNRLHDGAAKRSRYVGSDRQSMGALAIHAGEMGAMGGESARVGKSPGRTVELEGRFPVRVAVRGAFRVGCSVYRRKLARERDDRGRLIEFR